MRSSTKVFLFLITLLALLMTAVAKAESPTEDRLVITMGRLTTTGTFAIQVITLENKTSKWFSRISVECGFYAGSLLAGVGHAAIENIEPRSQAHKSAFTLNCGDADHVKCRINDAE
jgi:hypothetical protein